MAVCIGICAERLQHIGGQLPADHKLRARTVCQLRIFHAGKARAVALDHVHQAVIAVCAGENAGLERLVPRRFQKRDCLFQTVAVKIGQLHGLLVHAGYRRGIRSILTVQKLFDHKLQPVIFIRMPRQRIQLVDRFDKTA